jgi:hypothetical protein
MELPDELKIRAIFTQGGAFKAKVSRKDEYPRYYFILNRSPETDEKMVLLSSTTRFEEHRNCDGGDDVHIPLSPTEYKEFTAKCLICCNRPILVPKSNLVKQLKSQKYQLLDHLPHEIVKQIVNGIAKSNVVESITKALVVGEDLNNNGR